MAFCDGLETGRGNKFDGVKNKFWWQDSGRMRSSFRQSPGGLCCEGKQQKSRAQLRAGNLFGMEGYPSRAVDSDFTPTLQGDSHLTLHPLYMVRIAWQPRFRTRQGLVNDTSTETNLRNQRNHFPLFTHASEYTLQPESCSTYHSLISRPTAVSPEGPGMIFRFTPT